MKTPEAYVGKWRITHMDGWDQDVVDLDVPGHFIIRKNGVGAFQFGSAQGEMDCRVERMGGESYLTFSWEGSDDCHAVTGRGWMKADGKKMDGHIFFHLGDDSAFKTKKQK